MSDLFEEQFANDESMMTDWNKDKPSIKDTYEGTAVLMANGKSLDDVPREFLNKYHTIGTNNIYLYGMTDEEVAQYPGIPPKFYPDFYTILGANQIDTEEKRSYSLPLIEKAQYAFVNRIRCRHYDLPNIYGIHGKRLSTGTRPSNKAKFSYDIMDYVGIGFTNTYVMLQILYYLGFKEVLCVGLDNDYGADPERLHFYANDSRFSNEPNMGRTAHRNGSNYVFGLANEAYKKDGRKIININKKNNTVFEGRQPEW